MATSEKGSPVPLSARAMMTARRGTAGSGAGVGTVPFGASASGFRHQGIASTYERVRVPNDVAAGLALIARNLAKGPR